MWLAAGTGADGLLAFGTRCDDRNVLAPALGADERAGVVALGCRHAFILLPAAAAGEYACVPFGANEVGQCGGVHAATVAATAAAPLRAVRALALGWDRTVVLCADGSVVTLGGASARPPVAFPPVAPRVVSLACSEATSFAVLEDGAVYGWGSARHGLLPSASASDAAQAGSTALHLSAVSASAGSAGRPLIVHAGWRHAAVVTSGGSLVTWGSNKRGACGRRGEEASRDGLLAPGVVPLSAASEGPGWALVDVATGWHFMLARLRRASSTTVDNGGGGGALLSWGRGDMGQLGRPLDGAHDCAPGLVHARCGRDGGGTTDVTALACGSEHAVAALACGCAVAWGWNEHGCLGTGDTRDRYEPTAVRCCRGGGAESGCEVRSVYAGGAVTLLEVRTG
jgi:alpha-tubulin suppressor-like RCC1 family protein